VLLEVEGLSIAFAGEEGIVPVTEDVSFRIAEGQTLALVGESGCGKSVTAGAVMRLLPHPAGRVTAGSVRLRGRELLSLPAEAMYGIRGGEWPWSSRAMACLNPVLGPFQVEEVLSCTAPTSGRDRRTSPGCWKWAADLGPGGSYFQLSGGCASGDAGHGPGRQAAPADRR
jgi:ABC-type glutathione transport system ATPase component